MPLVATLAALGVFFVCLALFLRVGFTGAALFILAAEYLLAETTGSVSTLSIGLHAVGLIVLCEIVFWVSDLAAHARMDTAVVAGFLRGIALIGIAGALLAVVTLTAAGLQIPGFLAGTIIGSAAAVLLLALPRLLAGSGRAGNGDVGRSE